MEGSHGQSVSGIKDPRTLLFLPPGALPPEGYTLQEEKTPIKNNDHPEEDQSPILDNEMHTEYQSLLGMLQWIISLCRIDI